MGYTSYSVDSRTAYTDTIKHKSINDIFQNFISEKEFVSKSEMNPKGLVIRESRDSDIHPESVAIIIGLDVTGSMGKIPEYIVKEDLTTIMNELIAAGIEHPQILFVAIGDHVSDRAPLQVGQFESGDQELAKWLEATWLEGWGGGTAEESYSLAWLVGGWHTSIDCWEKRKQKGFIFTIGDEKAHAEIDPATISRIVGTPGQNWKDSDMLAKAQETYNVYHIHTNDGSYPNNNEILGYWRNLLKDNLIIVDKHTEIGKKIVDTIKQNIKGEVKIDNKPNTVL